MKRILVALTVLAAAAGAQAQSQSVSGSASGTAPLDNAIPLTLASFNSTLGTLQTATLTLYSSIGGTITIGGGGNTGNVGTVTTNFTFSSSLRELNQLLANITHTNTLTTGSQSTTINVAPIMSSLGTGTFDVSCTPSSTTVPAGNSLAGANGQCAVGSNYTYLPTANNAVPEPSSIALLGLALAGVGVASRRRKA